MKYTTTTLLVIAAMSTAAQQRPIALSAHPEARDTYRIPAEPGTPGTAKEITYYTETFDNDLNGWTATNNIGSLNWMWTNTGPGPTNSTYPVPPLSSSSPEGWVIIDDDHDGTPGQNTDSWLVSPSIDLSFAPEHVKIEFEQYFQEYNSDRTFVGISTNGGNTWNEVEINEGVGRDGRPNPELIDVDISEWLSGDRSDVRVRFRYEAVWDYGWQIDNVSIRDLPEDDMALLEANNTAFDFDNTGFEQMDYSIYPTSQLTQLLPSMKVRNKGSEAQTGVVASLRITGPSGTEVTIAAPSDTYNSGTEQVVALDPFEPDHGTGTYDLTFMVEQDAEDMVPSNNSRTASFSLSDNVYAHDDGNVDAYQTQGIDHVDEPFEVGNHYYMIADGVATGLQIALHPNTPVGSSIYGAIYIPSASAANHPTLVDLTDIHIVTSADLSEVGSANFITLSFRDPIALSADNTYLLVVGSSIGDQGVHFATSGASAAQVSIIHYPNAGSAFEFYVTRTPMVRMVLQGPVGIAEPDAGLADLMLAPNPASRNTTIDFTLRSAEHVAIHVMDMTGRVVWSEDLGVRAMGQHRVTLDAAGWAAGTYTCALSTDRARLTHRLVVAH